MLVLITKLLVDFLLKEILRKQFFSTDGLFLCMWWQMQPLFSIAKRIIWNFYLLQHHRRCVRGVRYQESGTKADKRTGRYSEIPGW